VWSGLPQGAPERFRLPSGLLEEIWPLLLERARIGQSGVGLGRVVSDLLEREAGEFRGEFA
jgi:hypothetical protein